MQVAISPSVTSDIHDNQGELVKGLMAAGHSIMNVSFGQFASSEHFTQFRNTSREAIKDQPGLLITSFARTDGMSANDRVTEALLFADTWKGYGGGPLWIANLFGPLARGDQERPAEELKGKFDSVACRMAARHLAVDFEGFSTIEIHSEKARQLLVDQFGASNVFTLDPTEILAQDLEQFTLHDPVVISPDKGANARADALAKRLNADRFYIDKKRNVIETTIVGYSKDVSVKGRTCILVDDMGDSLGTVDNAVRLIHSQDPKEQFVSIPHPILTDPASTRIGKLLDSGIVQRFAFCNTINRTSEISRLRGQYSAAAKGLQIVGVEPLLLPHIEEIAKHPSMQMGEPA